MCFHNNKANFLGIIFYILNGYPLEYPTLVLLTLSEPWCHNIDNYRMWSVSCKLLDCSTFLRGFVSTIQWHNKRSYLFFWSMAPSLKSLHLFSSPRTTLLFCGIYFCFTIILSPLSDSQFSIFDIQFVVFQYQNGVNQGLLAVEEMVKVEIGEVGNIHHPISSIFCSTK